MIYYAIIIGVSFTLIFLSYAYGYSQGWRDSSKVKPLDFLDEHSSHADPTVPRELQRH